MQNTLTKSQKITYWICTVLVAAMMLMASYSYLTSAPQVVEGMAHFGYPLYFATFLGIAKLLGAVALLYTRFRTLTEWAYAGFTFTFLGAAFSHYSAGDGMGKVCFVFVALALLMVSYYFWKKGVRSAA